MSVETLTEPELRAQAAERRQALAGALTLVGVALFLQGALCTLFGSAADAPLPLKLAGWFVVAGGLLPHTSALGSWLHSRSLRVRAFLMAPSDGVLEMLLGGLVFIVLLLAMMVSLWSPTVR